MGGAGNERTARWHRAPSAAFAAAVLLTLTVAPSVTLAAPPPPVFGHYVDAAPVHGKVKVTLPGRSPVALASPRRIPVGSTFDVTGAKNAVRLTAADGKGRTYSGIFSNGSFTATQSVSGTGTTEIVLVGRCVKATKDSDAPSASAARRPRHRTPVYRQLQISANGEFEVIGTDATATAQTSHALYSLVDQCDGTQILSDQGTVAATTTTTGTRDLHPGQSFIDNCQPSAAQDQYCTLVLSSPRSSVFSFGLVFSSATATSFQVCYTTPQGRNSCHTAPLGSAMGGGVGGLLGCTVNDGRGGYPVRFLVDGHQVGATLRFKATQPRDPSLGSDFCEGEALNSSSSTSATS